MLWVRDIVVWDRSPGDAPFWQLPIGYWNSYLSTRLRGIIKQKECIIHSWTLRCFLLFYPIIPPPPPPTHTHTPTPRSPRGAYIQRGDLTEGFLGYRFGALIFGGAYFRNITVVVFTHIVLLKRSLHDETVQQNKRKWGMNRVANVRVIVPAVKSLTCFIL